MGITGSDTGFSRLDVLPLAQPTVPKHCKHLTQMISVHFFNQPSSLELVDWVTSPKLPEMDHTVLQARRLSIVQSTASNNRRKSSHQTPKASAQYAHFNWKYYYYNQQLYESRHTTRTLTNWKKNPSASLSSWVLSRVIEQFLAGSWILFLMVINDMFALHRKMCLHKFKAVTISARWQKEHINLQSGCQNWYNVTKTGKK